MFDLVAVRGELARELARVRAGAGSSGSVADWVELVGSCQEAVNVLTAIQTIALAQVAAIEEVACEDGTVVEEHRGLGHQRLDAPALVQDVLGLTASGATDRVAGAVDLVVRHPRLVQAMADGRLDAYRAGVVARELSEAEADVCAVVVDRLEDHLASEAGGALRRRTRRLLASVDADLVRRAATRARGERSLRRCAFAPGVDEWSATLPVEQSRAAWSVVDGLARRYVAEGTCAGIEQARADALLDLVLSRATGTVGVTLTVPASVMTRAAQDASTVGSCGAGEQLVPVTGFGMPGVTHLRASWLTSLVRGSDVDEMASASSVWPASQRSQQARMQVMACDDVTGALTSLPVPIRPPAGRPGRASNARAERIAAARRASLAVAARGGDSEYRPPGWLIDLVKARDGQCRFPGCTVSASVCDLDHVVAWPVGATHPSNLVCLCRRHHRVKQRLGWRVRLDPDGTLVWTDPCGRQRSTVPEDHLHPDLPAAASPDGPATAAEPGRKRAAPPPQPTQPPVPSILEDEVVAMTERRLVDLACQPHLLTGHNRRALREGRRVSTTRVTELVRPSEHRPHVTYPDRRYRLDPTSLATHDDHHPLRGHRVREHRSPRRPPGDDPPPF